MEEKPTILISAFPCCGKSYCFNKYSDKYSILDSDSSYFSWEKDKYGQNTNIRNKNFPSNYMQYISENIGKVDFIFVSSHKEVREALLERGWRFLLVYPELTCRDEWIQRAKNRGSTQDFCDFLGRNWVNFYQEIRNMPITKQVIKQELGKKNYITENMLDTLYNYNKFFRAMKE